MLGRIGSYSQLAYSQNMSDPAVGKFYQTMQERTTDIANDLLFFTLEINRMDEAVLAAKMKAPVYVCKACAEKRLVTEDDLIFNAEIAPASALAEKMADEAYRIFTF